MQQRSWKSSSSNRKHLCTIFGISFWLFMTCVCCLKLQLPSKSLKHFETSNFPNAQHVLSMSYAPATFLPIQVCEALQQGLAPNLAHFCAKCILVAIKIGLGAIEFSFGVSWQDQTIGWIKLILWFLRGSGIVLIFNGITFGVWHYGGKSFEHTWGLRAIFVALLCSVFVCDRTRVTPRSSKSILPGFAEKIPTRFQAHISGSGGPKVGLLTKGTDQGSKDFFLSSATSRFFTVDSEMESLK